MKKLLILAFSLLSISTIANAQLTLTGTSYTQNFDNIGSGLPLGWECYKSATSTSLGIPDNFNSAPAYGVFYDTISCPSEVFKHGSKNCASADIVSPTASCTQQQTITNRAFGVRQVGATHPGYDPGSAFVLHLTNTSGKSTFSASFKLQSLDIRSTKRTMWVVDYGIGSSPTAFTQAAATGYFITGNRVFSDTTITVNFGAALDNQNQDVWIRIVTLIHSWGGPGHRTTTAIDDFVLSYLNASFVPVLSAPASLNFSVIGEAKADNIIFSYSIEKAGYYDLDIYDIQGNLVYKKPLDLINDLKNKIVINDINVCRGMYIAKLSNETAQGIVKLIIQ